MRWGSKMPKLIIGQDTLTPAQSDAIAQVVLWFEEGAAVVARALSIEEDEATGGWYVEIRDADGNEYGVVNPPSGRIYIQDE